MKVGRNDPCPCNSGKKYKKCCMINIEEKIPFNNLFKIRTYGSEFYNREELDFFSSFYIETSFGERFEIKRTTNKDYLLKDINPPVLEKRILSYRTAKFNDLQLQKLKRPNPLYSQVDIGSHEDFNGIIKGGHFSWENYGGDYTCTRGIIDKLYVPQDIGNTKLNIHLFPPSSPFKTVGEYLDKGFSIYTQTEKYDIEIVDGALLLDKSVVVAIFSLFDLEILETVPSVFNVSLDIVIGKPFMIIKIHNEIPKISFVNQKVIDVTSL